MRLAWKIPLIPTTSIARRDIGIRMLGKEGRSLLFCGPARAVQRGQGRSGTQGTLERYLTLLLPSYFIGLVRGSKVGMVA